MHKPVLMDADVDEHAEIDDVAHRSAEHHAGLQILQLQHIRAQNRRGQLVARVAAGLDKLFYDILQRRHADAAFCRSLFRTVGAELVGKIGHFRLSGIFEIDVQQLRQLLRRVVALRMHARAVEHLLAFRHTQKACALLKRLRPQLRHLFDLCTRGERAVLLAVGDNIFRRRRIEARDLL